MTLPEQAIFPGVLESAYRRGLQNLVAKNAVSRLWDKDTSLWSIEEHHTESAKSNLGWLDLPQKLGPLMARVAARVSDIEPAGFEDVVFVSIGGSSLAAETILRLPSAKIGKRAFLLDNIDPDCIRSLEGMLRLDKTLFIFADKSGTGIETHSLLLYFLQKLKTLGISSPASRFVALSEENSYLGQLAGEYEFADSFIDPPGIQGRYSSLIHFNFFLAALCQLDQKDLLTRAQSMRDACGPFAPQEANPALSLAAFLAAGELQERNQLVLFSADSLKPVTIRIGSLVGVSTGKKGRGIIPIFGRSSSAAVLTKKCLVAILKMAGEEDGQLDKKCAEWKEAGVPMISIELHGPAELAAELFKWEIATALACSLLNVNPFYDPDVREGRAGTMQALEQITASRQPPVPTVRVREGDIELYAEGETRQQISTLNMSEALRTFFGLGQPDYYLALLPFLGMNASQQAILGRITDQLVPTLGIPALVTPGPRYLQGFGQIFKGGPPKGLFILLTAKPEKDLPIPGASYSFGQLQRALAAGDFESLGRRRRPVIRLHLTKGAEQGLLQLESIFSKALGKKPKVSS